MDLSSLRFTLSEEHSTRLCLDRGRKRMRVLLLLVALSAVVSFRATSHASMGGMRVWSSPQEGEAPKKPRRPSAVGSGRVSPSSTGKNINEGNMQKNMDYHRNKQEREDKEWRRSDVQQGPSSSLSSNAKRRVYNGPEGGSSRRPSGGGGNRKAGEFSDALADQWQSGRVFQKRGGQRNGGRRRNDPWWMRDEERNNPRILPQYKPWWLENIMVDSSWKISDLRKEAMRRADVNGNVASAAGAGGHNEEEINAMKKAELVDLLVGLTEQYSLANDGFTSIEFIDSTGGKKPPCYPQVYEGGQDKMESIVLEAYDQILNKSE